MPVLIKSKYPILDELRNLLNDYSKAYEGYEYCENEKIPRNRKFIYDIICKKCNKKYKVQYTNHVILNVNCPCIHPQYSPGALQYCEFFGRCFNVCVRTALSIDGEIKIFTNKNKKGWKMDGYCVLNNQDILIEFDGHQFHGSEYLPEYTLNKKSESTKRTYKEMMQKTKEKREDIMNNYPKKFKYINISDQQFALFIRIFSFCRRRNIEILHCPKLHDLLFEKTHEMLLNCKKKADIVYDSMKNPDDVGEFNTDEEIEVVIKNIYKSESYIFISDFVRNYISNELYLGNHVK